MPEPTAGDRFFAGIFPENPTYRQLLGMCPTLAVSAAMSSAVTMGLCVIVVLLCSNIITSLIRGLVKPHLRILLFTGIIAVFVTAVDRVLAAYMPSMSETLGPYVPLIIVNCIVLCRCEVCASKQGVVAASADAIGQGLGFTLGLASLASVREILGQGTWFGIGLINTWWEPWVIMLLAPGSFITLGLLIGSANWIGQARQDRAARRRRTARQMQAALAAEPSAK